jgi:probable HAF family extracellular repeat protein
VNDRGEVVGASTNSGEVATAFIWTRRDGMESLGVIDGRADAINEHGDVAGFVNTAAGQRPFFIER